MKKILVTGGAGYIGAHTVVALAAAGYVPIVLDNFSNTDVRVLEGLQRILGTSVSCHKGDCEDEAFVRKVLRTEEGILGVIHFAAHKSVNESIQQPLAYYKNNIASLWTLLSAMEACGVGLLIFSSSCTVYGDAEEIPVREETPFGVPASPYGYTKQVCERLLYDHNKSDSELRMTSLRYFNPIGAHPSAAIGEEPLGTPNNLIPLLTQAAAGIRERLVVYGQDYATTDGTCIRDYVHVMDLAEVHVEALRWLEGQKEGCYEVYNCGTGRGRSVLEVIRAFETVNQVKVPYVMGPRREGDVACIYAGVDKVQKHLGWTSRFSFAQALEDAWRWQKTL